VKEEKAENDRRMSSSENETRSKRKDAEVVSNLSPDGLMLCIASPRDEFPRPRPLIPFSSRRCAGFTVTTVDPLWIRHDAPFPSRVAHHYGATNLLFFNAPGHGQGRQEETRTMKVTFEPASCLETRNSTRFRDSLSGDL
jgi:hypothetical protein